jgi:hypothetical protein
LIILVLSGFSEHLPIWARQYGTAAWMERRSLSEIISVLKQQVEALVIKG